MEQLAAGLRSHDRPTGSTSASSSGRSASGSNELVGPRGRGLRRPRSRPRSRDAGIRLRSTGTSSTTTTARTSTRSSTESIFPVLTPARRRPRPSVPLHLEPVAQPRRSSSRDPSSGDERFARVKVPPLLPRFVVAARRRALRAARAGHRGPPRRALPRHGDRSRTTRSGSPATPTSTLEEEADDLLEAVEIGAAPARVRARRAPRGRHQDDRRGARAARAGSSSSPTTTST